MKVHVCNTLGPEQNDHHLTDNIFSWMFWTEKLWVGVGEVYFLGSNHHQGCLNLGWCAACWANFMCHHELYMWPASVNIPSLFSIVLQFIPENNLSLYLDFLSKFCFSMLHSLYMYSLLFLLLLFTFFWLGCDCSMFCFCPGNYLVISRNIVNWCRFVISHYKSTQSGPSLFCVFF